MKIRYDKQLDVLYIMFNLEHIVESDEEIPGIIMDYSKTGVIAGIEILNASKCVNDLSRADFEMI
jgi:uncharacterized protein YuzE